MNWRRVLVAGVVALSASGCDEGISAGVAVDNRTSAKLHFRVQLEPGRGWYTAPGQLGPNESTLVLPAPVMPPGGCTAGAMVALDEADREVARHDEPLCIDDIWIIDSLAVPSPSR
jgi:hypothetical protein